MALTGNPPEVCCPKSDISSDVQAALDAFNIEFNQADLVIRQAFIEADISLTQAYIEADAALSQEFTEADANLLLAINALGLELTELQAQVTEDLNTLNVAILNELTQAIEGQDVSIASLQSALTALVQADVTFSNSLISLSVADTALSNGIDAVDARVDTTLTALATETAARASLAQSISTQFGQVTSDYIKRVDLFSAEGVARASDLENFRVTVDQNTATASTFLNLLATETTARIQEISTLTTAVGNNSASLISTIDLLATETSARISQAESIQVIAEGALAQANTSISLLADETAERIKVQNNFAYNSVLKINGKYYYSGFGLDSSGISQVNDGETEATAWDSEFWVNAESMVLRSPTYPGISARFTVTASGLTLGLEHTEATRNVPKGAHVQANTYDEGDMVTTGSSSYIALQDVPADILITNTTYWSVLATGGVSYIGTQEYYKLTNTSTTPTSGGISGTGWSTTPQTPISTNRYLWNYNVNSSTTGSTASAVSLITQYVTSGSNGRGISGITETYQLGLANKTQPSGSWVSNISSLTMTDAYPFIWNKTVISFTSAPLTETIYTIIAAKGTDGTIGADGSRGTATLTYSGSTGSSPPVPVNAGDATGIAACWSDAASGTPYVTAVIGDNLVVTNTSIDSGWTHIYKYTGTAWTSASTFMINGNQIVTGSLTVLNDITIGGDSTFSGLGTFDNGLAADYGNYFLDIGVDYLGNSANRAAIGYDNGSTEAGLYINSVGFCHLITTEGSIQLSAFDDITLSCNQIKIGTNSTVDITLKGDVLSNNIIIAPEFKLSSDERIKSSIAPIQNALEKAILVGGDLFNRDDLKGKRQAGIIAQKLQKAVPEACEEVDGILRVDPMAAIGLLFAALQELTEEVRTPWYKKLFKRYFK